jgi:hypothetical protein
MRLRCQHRPTLDYELICKIMDDLGVGRQDGGCLIMGYEIGDSIHGRRVMADAGKVSDPMVIVKSARHTKCSG